MHEEPENIAIIGCGGAIGGACVKLLRATYPQAVIHAFSRQLPAIRLKGIFYHRINYKCESSIGNATRLASAQVPLDLVILATGILHDGPIMPEKALHDLAAEKFRALFEANAIVPALLAKHFLPCLNRARRSVFAALSARVGSISENRLGGWYAYRASKAALNMVIKNAAIETGRHNRQAIIVGLHPGTVDSGLSKPFQRNVPTESLFTPSYAATQLVQVIADLTPEQSGKCFAWDGKEILP